MKYEYMKESEQMLQYFQFPKFLLKLRISQNAKFLYMILYDRARISRKNSWIDKYGNVYLIFPIEELSAQIGKCKSSVKTALKELDDVGLLVRRSGGFSKPNHLYVKIPSDGQTVPKIGIDAEQVGPCAEWLNLRRIDDGKGSGTGIGFLQTLCKDISRE